MSAETRVGDLGERLAARIEASGPLTLHDYMTAANAAYYASRDPLGAGGDFTTAPEISQMFGEMIGLWLGDVWQRAGQPDAAYVELGPGRGTLAADALRAMARVGLSPAAHLVETSPTLRLAQSRTVPGAAHHDSIDTLPTGQPLLIVANEFFDALPIRQYLRTDAGWREQCLVNDRAEPGHRFLPLPGAADVTDAIAAPLRDATPGTVWESCPAARSIMASLAARLARQGGVLLAIDYGYWGPLAGDSFQAVQAHRFADPFVEPGARDLTAHVDFAALADAAREGGAVPAPLVEQGAFLTRLGIAARAQTLAARNPGAAEAVRGALHRLTAAEAMGRLFKVLAVRAPGWPEPEGIA